jgi:UDP-N-acetylglucosamine--N-acetylmuramyl-(pentapeptide) pyrophosphoryl-undecaprenol N-acetylglucosamine transferase
MTIVVTGGGSGGHITPLLAVASELKKQQPDVRIVYIGQRGDRLAEIVKEHDAIDEVRYIWAGKFRRYHGEGLKQLLDIKTVLLNIRDVFLVGLGFISSIRVLRSLKPSVIFIKGGFVGVPVGLAAALLHIPYITHDSDAIAGLANRIVARWARLHAVALPKEVYSYPPAKTVTVGVPIASEYAPVDTKQADLFRHSLGIEQASHVLFITGGGLGAKKINDVMVKIVPRLLGKYPGLYVIHTTGHAQSEAVTEQYKPSLDRWPPA